MADPAQSLTFDSFMAQQAAPPPKTGEENFDTFMQKAKYFGLEFPEEKPKQPSLFEDATREMARGGLPAPAPAGQKPDIFAEQKPNDRFPSAPTPQPEGTPRRSTFMGEPIEEPPRRPGEPTMRQVMQPALTGPAAMPPEYNQLAPKSDDTWADSISKAVVGTVTGAVSAENLAVMLGAQGGASLLKAAVNAPAVAAALRGAPAVAKAIDIAANTAIPGTFTLQNLIAGGHAGKAAYDAWQAGDQPRARQEAINALTNGILAGLGAAGTAEAAKGTAAGYPPEPTPKAKAQAEKVGGIARPVPPAQAAQTAEGLQAGGRRLAAGAWENLYPGDATNVRSDVGPVTIEKTGTHPKYGDSFQVTDAQGNVIKAASGNAEQVSNWMRLHAPERFTVPAYPAVPVGTGVTRVLVPAEEPGGFTANVQPGEGELARLGAVEPGQAQTPTVPGLEPTHPEAIKVGQVFEGESGKYTVNDIQNGKVKFTAETKAGNVSGTMKLESFQKRMQDQGLMPPIQTQEPTKDEDLVPPSAVGGPAGVVTQQPTAPSVTPAPVVQPPQAAPEGAEKQAELRNMPDSMIAEELRRPEAERRYDYNALLGEATARGITLSGEKPAATFDAFMEQQKPQAQTPTAPEPEPTHPEASNVVSQQQDARQKLLASLSAKQPENLPMPSEPAKGAKTGSVEDLVRGSADVHLSPAGHEQADERGKQLVQNLGYGLPGDILVTGDLTRAKQTGAHILQHAPDVHVLPANQELDTWGLGGAIEGKPTNDKAIKQQIRDLVEKHPDQVPEQGEGGVSTRPAESFNQFKSGFLQGGLQPLMRAYEEAPADAKPMVVAVIHGRGVRVAKGWEAKGTPADHSIDNSFMLDDTDKPGEVYRFAPDKQGKWKLSEVDPAKPQVRQPGILLMRHAETPWNKTDTATRGRGDTAQKPETPQAQTRSGPSAPTTHPEASSPGVKAPIAPPSSQPHDYSSTQVNLPPNISTALIAYGESIPDENIGKEGRETEPHITVKYGLHTSDLEKLRKLLEDEPPITATLGKTSVFADTKTENDGKEDVLKVSVESPDLHRLNKKISDALPHTDTYPDYKPHATIAYLKNGQGKQYAGQEIPGVTGQQFTLNSITFSGKDGNKVEIPLSGEGIGTYTEHKLPGGGQIQELRSPETIFQKNAHVRWYDKNGKQREGYVSEVKGFTVMVGDEPNQKTVAFRPVQAKDLIILAQPKAEETGLAERGYLILEAEGLPGRKVPVTDAEQASNILSAYRDQNNLGGSQFTERTGNLVTASGKVIARVGYNGRVWAPDGTLLWEPKGMTLPMEPGQRVTAAAFETGQQPEPAPATFDSFMEQQKNEKPNLLAITGNTYPFRSNLKALGAQWNKEEKSWTIPNTPQNKAAVQKISANFSLKEMGAPAATSAETEVPKTAEEQGFTVGGFYGKATPKGDTGKATAEALRKAADGMSAQIEAKRNPAIAQQNPTARRANIAAGMANEADNMERVQTVLRGLADAHEQGTVPIVLAKVTSRAAIEDLLRGRDKFPYAFIHSSWIQDLEKGLRGKPGAKTGLDLLKRRMSDENGGVRLYNEGDVDTISDLVNGAEKAGIRTAKYAKSSLADAKRLYKAGINDQNWKQATEAIKQFTKAKPAEKPAERQIRDLERELIGRKIEGFFPTPPELAARMAEEADIEPGMAVLEPSAGNGRIADAIAKQGVDVTTIEPQSQLSKILELKGHKVLDDRDFMEHKGQEYDRIVMNPPFERQQDIDHVRHAYDLLKPGGRVVAIMGEHAFFAGDKKSAGFRQWLEEQGGTSEKLPSGTFEKSGTGVASRLVVLDKVAAKPTPQATSPAPEAAKTEVLAPDNKPTFVEKVAADNPDVDGGAYTVNRWPGGQYQVKHFSRGLNSSFGSNFPSLEEAKATIGKWNENYRERAKVDAEIKAKRKQEADAAVQQAMTDWKSGRAYVDAQGNYHLKPEGQKGGSGPIAPWNKEARAAFKSSKELHIAANEKRMRELEAQLIKQPVAAEPEPLTPAETPAPFTEAEKTFHDTYQAELSRYSADREKAYPSAKLMQDWDALQRTGKLETNFGHNNIKPVSITTQERKEGAGKKRHTVSSYILKLPNGTTYTYDWESEFHKDWAATRALSRGLGSSTSRVSGGMDNEIHGAMVNHGDYVSYHEKQYALREALKKAMPGVTIPQLSTVVKVPQNPTLQDAIAAVAESLPRNLGDLPARRTGTYMTFDERYVDEVQGALKKYQDQLDAAVPIIGADHPRALELQKLIDDARTELRVDKTLHEQRVAKEQEEAKTKAEEAARQDAAYYARFGTDAAAPDTALEKYAKLAGWKETGHALNERALKEFGIEKNQLKPLDLSDIKLKKSDLDILRETKLNPEGSFIGRRLSIGQEAEMKARGWLSEGGIHLTEKGERAAIAVHQADAEDQAGRPMSEYKPGSGRLPDPGESRFAMNAPIPYKGDVWHTNGHYLVLGAPPKYWTAPAPGTKPTLPDIGKVMPTEAGATTKPVGFATKTIKHLPMRVVYFSNGHAVDSVYFDYINKTHAPDKWTSESAKEGSPLQAWKGQKRVALLMGLRVAAEEAPERIQKLIAEAKPEQQPAKPPAKPSPNAAADDKWNQSILKKVAGQTVETKLEGAIPKPLPDVYVRQFRGKPDRSLETAQSLVGGFYESYGGGIDQITAVSGDDSHLTYTVRDVNTGAQRQHGTFIDPRAVTFKTDQSDGAVIARPRTEIQSSPAKSDPGFLRSADAKYEKLLAGAHGHIYINRAAATILRSALHDAGYDTVPFQGVMLPYNKADAVYKVLGKTASQADPELRSSLDRIRTAMQQALQHLPHGQRYLTFVEAEPNTSAIEIRRTRKEEEFHRQQYQRTQGGPAHEMHVDAEPLKRNPGARIAYDAEKRRRPGLTDQETFIEVGAGIAAGNWSELDLDREQALAAFTAYYENTVGRHGEPMKDIIRYAHPYLQKSITGEAPHVSIRRERGGGGPPVTQEIEPGGKGSGPADTGGSSETLRPRAATGERGTGTHGTPIREAGRPDLSSEIGVGGRGGSEAQGGTGRRELLPTGARGGQGQTGAEREIRRTVPGQEELGFLKSESGESRVIEQVGELLRNFREAIDTPSDKDFGAKLRTFVVGTRDVEIAETNQLRDRIKRLVPDAKEREAVTLMRDFANRPGELEEFAQGTHSALDDVSPERRHYAMRALEQLQPVIDKALHPTPDMELADAVLTRYFEDHLERGRELGMLDSDIGNEEYIPHLYEGQNQQPGIVKRMFQKAGIGPRQFKFAKQRKYPTVLHAIAHGIRPKTLDAMDALTIYGEKYATSMAARMLVNELKDSGMGKWGTHSQQRKGKIPPDWVELSPENRMFRNEIPFIDQEGEAQVSHQMLFVPSEVQEALRPVIEPNYMTRVPGFEQGRAYQAYIKAVELGLSAFHMKALGLSGLANEGITGLVKTFQADMHSPAFEEQEKQLIRAGGTTTILGRTAEAYHNLRAESLPTGADKVLSATGLKQVQNLARVVTDFTFDTIQRKLKVTDFALKDAAWLAKHPNATSDEHFRAQRAIAKELNAVYGGLNWEILGVHRLSLALAKALMLAPDWTYSNWFSVKTAFEGGPGGNAARLFWLKAAIWGLGLTALATALIASLSKRDPKQAVEKWMKHPTQVYLGRDKRGKEIQTNSFFVGAPGDLVNLVDYIKQYGLFVGLGHFLGNKLGPFAKTTEQEIANEDEFGRPLVRRGKSGKVEVFGRTVIRKAPAGVVGTVKGAEQAAKNIVPLPFSASTLAQMAMDPKRKYTLDEYLWTAINGRRPSAVEATSR